MLLRQREIFVEQEKKISDKILNWSLKDRKFLNIVSVPYNSTKIFVNTIIRFLSEGKSILYITDEMQGSINIICSLKEHVDFKNYTYIKDGKCAGFHTKLNICNYDTALILESFFDLVIYDDISSFSIHSKDAIAYVLHKFSEMGSKVIAFSIEKILDTPETVSFPMITSRVPMVEPRLVTTRFNINKDIPFVIYDYLKWSIKEHRKVIIYVPDELKINNVCKYIRKYCGYFINNIICFIENKSNKKDMVKFFNLDKAIMITNYFHNLPFHIKNLDVMVYFADKAFFDYKKFIFLCGNVMRGESDLKGEVVFLANYETEHIEKARNIARNFNREAWDMGLLKV